MLWHVNFVSTYLDRLYDIRHEILDMRAISIPKITTPNDLQQPLLFSRSQTLTYRFDAKDIVGERV